MSALSRPPAGLRRAVNVLGPGLIAGAAGDDPTGIATYAQAGAQAGYGLLWTAVLTVPMMVAVQYLAAKLALVRGRPLAELIKERYPRPVLYGVAASLILANALMAGADLGAVAAAINLLIPVPVDPLIVLVSAGLLAFLIWGKFAVIENTFKWLALALLAYVVSAVLARPDAGAVLKGALLPEIQLNRTGLLLLVAVLGGNISPYLFFWQADLEATEAAEAPAEPDEHALRARLRVALADTATGMVFSNLVVFFIEVATAATLFRAGRHDVSTAVQAAAALEPFLGPAARPAWAIGVIGSALLAVPALLGTIAQVTATACGWNSGLQQRVGQAGGFYAVLVAATLVGVLMNFLGVSFVQALVLAAAVNGFVAPPMIALLLLLSNDPRVTGGHRNGRLLNLLGWATAGLTAVAAAGLLVSFL